MPLESSLPTVICVTPVRNEAWILERFLDAAEVWADHIIVADQGSTDDTREIAQGFGKVRLIENHGSAYDEGARQRLLLDAAREIPGRRLIVALDADEFLTANWKESGEWAQAQSDAEGTVFRFDWVNVLPGGRAYVPAQKVPFAFLDDGSEHTGESIHSTRIPVGHAATVRDLNDVKILHLQFVDWERMKSKQRWYQCWEVLNNRRKRAIQIYRQYHRMEAFPTDQIYPVDPTWFSGSRQAGIDVCTQISDEAPWWDEEVLEWILTHGPRRFRKLDIWDVDWSGIACARGRSVASASVADPRGPLERKIHRWLAATQANADRPATRWLQRLLIAVGW